MNFENPFTKGFDAWTKMTEESWTRTAAFFAEFEKMEAKGVERAQSAVAEMAKLTTEAIAYNANLRAEWRKHTLESLKQANGAITKAANVATNGAVPVAAQPS